MTKHNASNERIKRKYFAYLKEAKRHSEQTVDAAAKALDRFEVYTQHRDFRVFRLEQAIAFKRHLAEQKGQRSGKELSKATLHATLTQLRRFFQWLAWEPSYKSRLRYPDAEYFNLSDKDTRIARARREQKVPTLEQVNHVIHSMPVSTEIGQRNRALIAFTLLSGARDSAIASMKLKHVDLAADSIDQDAREVNTKFSKTFTTFFFPVGDDIRRIVVEWVLHLRQNKRWGNDDPPFPSTRIALGAARQFEASGLERRHWRIQSGNPELSDGQRRARRRARAPRHRPGSSASSARPQARRSPLAPCEMAGARLVISRGRPIADAQRCLHGLCSIYTSMMNGTISNSAPSTQSQSQLSTKYEYAHRATPESNGANLVWRIP
jgi:site-specific recombinase XerD